MRREATMGIVQCRVLIGRMGSEDCVELFTASIRLK